MTQQPPPQSSTPEGSGPAGPPPQPGWTPAPLSDGSPAWLGSAPLPPTPATNPLGGPALEAVRIEEFAPPKSRLPLVVTLVVLLVAAGIWAGTMLRPPAPVSIPSRTPSPTATETASGLPFLTPDERYSGRWEVVEHRWTDSGLEVQIRIAVERGPFSYSFLAFENSGVDATDADRGSQQPWFSGLPIESGQEEVGWLFFPLERGPVTIILATATGNQMSALAVSG